MYYRFLLLLSTILTASLLTLQTTRAETDPRASAIAAWYFGDGISNETNSISSVGFITYDVVPTGRGARPNRRTAQLGTPSYFNAGTALGVSNNQITVFLRARSQNGSWDSGLLAKRGSLSTLNYNLFAVDLPGTAGLDIGFELRTGNAFLQISFPISRIDPTAWLNLVGRYDGTNAQLFCNDRLMASAPLTGSLSLNNEPTLIGAETDGGTIVRRFTGFIEEAAIWNFALSDVELAVLNNLTATNDLYPTKLLHYRHPDHDVGDVHIRAGTNGAWDLTYQYLVDNVFYQASLTTYDFLNFRWSNPVHTAVLPPNLLATWFAIESIWDPFQNKWRSIWGYQGMRSSISGDRLSWYAPSPQLLLPTQPGYEQFRDPSITQVGVNSWQMVMTTRKDSTGRIGYATSTNLVDWTFKGDLYAPSTPTPYVPEVPTLFQLGNKWYLMASWYANAVGAPFYVASDLPTGPWTEFVPNTLDGKDVCAAVSDSNGTERILMAWIPLYAWNDSNQHWGGHLCFPREIYKLNSGKLRARFPERFLDAIRGPQLFPGLANPSTKSGSWFYDGELITCSSTGTGNRSILPGVYDRFEGDLTFTPGVGATRAGWLVNWAETSSFFEVGVDASSGQLFIRTAGGTVHSSLAVPVTRNVAHRLRMFVEEDMVELVFDDQFTLAARIPTKLLGTSIGLFTDGGPVTFSNAEVYRLKNLEQISVAPTLSVSRTNNGVVVTFSGVLQSASQVTGNYIDMPSAISPATIPATNTARFFRARTS